MSLLGETLIGLVEVARKFPGKKSNQRIHKSTVIRWCLKGTRVPDGRVVKLEHIRAGNKLLTSWEAVGRYVAALSEPPPDAPPARTPSRVNAGREVQRPPGSRAPVEMCSASFHVRP
jgi:hypothetical protein